MDKPSVSEKINLSSDTLVSTGMGRAEIGVWLMSLVFTVFISFGLWLFSVGLGWGASEFEKRLTYLVPVPGLLYLLFIFRRVKKIGLRPGTWYIMKWLLFIVVAIAVSILLSLYLLHS